jgi:hypothetical protein
MKHSVIAAFFLATSIANGASTERSALLILPAVVGTRHNLQTEVEFKWDGEAPIVIDTWETKGSIETLGELRAFSEDGTEVQQFYPLSIPTVPSGSKVVRPGEVLRIGLMTTGFLFFQKPGRYYAIAKFSGYVDKTRITFTTKKRWFEVVRSPPNA